jgi:ATP-dependent helicase/nuclease subunit A
MTYQAVEKREDEAESVRLFYVAATRARDALILSAGVAPDARPESPPLRLLDDRFDRRTGSFLGELPEGWGRPFVRVVSEPPAPGESSPRRRARPPLRAIANLITSTPQSRTPDVPPARWPEAVDLDPCARLPLRGARLGRLIASTLSDPQVLRQGGLGAAVRRAARRQEAMAGAGLITEVEALLARWLQGKLGGDIAGAERIERGVAWSVPWGSVDTGSPEPTVFHGRAEFLTRDRQGEWTAYLFSPPGSHEATERLRMLLTAAAAGTVVSGRVVRGWYVRLGERGGLVGEESFSLDALRDAARAAIDSCQTAVTTGAHVGRKPM